MDERLVRAFNRSSDALDERIRDFLILHYTANRRFGEPLWDHVRDYPLPDSLHHKLRLFDAPQNAWLVGVHPADSPPTEVLFEDARRAPEIGGRLRAAEGSTTRLRGATCGDARRRDAIACRTSWALLRRPRSRNWL